mgnify:CR=1 FL=1
MVIELGKTARQPDRRFEPSAALSPGRFLARILERIAVGRQAYEEGARATYALALSDALALLERLARAARDDGTILGRELSELYGEAGEGLLRVQCNPSDALLREIEQTLEPIYLALLNLAPPEPPPLHRKAAAFG